MFFRARSAENRIHFNTIAHRPFPPPSRGVIRAAENLEVIYFYCFPLRGRKTIRNMPSRQLEPKNIAERLNVFFCRPSQRQKKSNSSLHSLCLRGENEKRNLML